MSYRSRSDSARSLTPQPPLPRAGEGGPESSARRWWLALALALGTTLALTGPAVSADAPAEDPEEHHAEEDHSDDEDHGKGHGKGHGGHGGHGSSRLTDEARPLADLPERPKPLIELGEPFLGTGTLSPGFELPTGAVWQPSLLVFGTLRTAVQSFEPDTAAGGRITELSTRLDLFANLALTGSERLVAGIRATDGQGRFTSYFFEHPDPDLDGEFRDEIDADLEVLFFEGEIGEIFPNLDRDDFGSLDLGFSVGRQNLLFQEGLLINDTIDGFGLTRNTLLPGNSSNFRITAFYGWGNVDTSRGAERDGEMFALLTSTDLRKSTVDADVAYVRTDDATGDLIAAGISAVQRLGRTNSSFRLLASQAVDDPTPFANDGVLLFSELSWVPHGTHDLVYFNSFWAHDTYTPAARGVGGVAAGPLGRAGINFASVDIGSFDAPLSSQASDVVGGAFGYQRFLDHTRKQLLVELGFRVGTRSSVTDAVAATVRWQQAHGRRFVLVLDAFVAHRERLFGGDETPFGGRVELVVKF